MTLRIGNSIVHSQLREYQLFHENSTMTLQDAIARGKDTYAVVATGRTMKQVPGKRIPIGWKVLCWTYDGATEWFRTSEKR